MHEAGFPSNHADAHAEAVRDFAMKDLATKQDLEMVAARLEAAIAAQRAAMDALSDKMTIRLGAMIVAAGGLVFAAVRLLPY